MAFILPFDKEITRLADELDTLPAKSAAAEKLRKKLRKLECATYRELDPYEKFLLSSHPLRPKTLDYVRHCFTEVELYRNEDVRGDHLMVAGRGKIEIDGRNVEVMIIGQQTAPSSDRDELLKMPVEEYRRWNQGMGFPDGYRKAVWCMDQAEKRGLPVVVFVDTPGADPSEYSEEQGQAFAINEVIRRTTALRVPNLAYIISQGASGGAIAITPTNRTIMNQYATYMVISPGGCASILFRNRDLESIKKAAEGLRLTSDDALAQGTVDEVVQEGCCPGHRYPALLLEAGKEAIIRNLREIISLQGEEAEKVRRAKFFAMGTWGESEHPRSVTQLAEQAALQNRDMAELQDAIAEYLKKRGSKQAISNGNGEPGEELKQAARLQVAHLIYAVEHHDADYIAEETGVEITSLTAAQWAELREFILERRYGERGSGALHPPGGKSVYRRLHPVDWVRKLTDEMTFREFEETIRYCSVDQLHFPGYTEALQKGLRTTGLDTGIVTGTAEIARHPLVLTVNNFGFVGSSLCDEIGEKFRYAAHYAMEKGLPLVSVSMGGGARMQEGTPSMHRNIPKAQHALNEMAEAGVPHISVIADPTLGGTAISYGLRGDYMIVVRGSANIGFSGKRVVEQFQQRPVAADFQHETWLLARGFVDECVATDDMRRRLTELLQHIAAGRSLVKLQRRRQMRWQPGGNLPEIGIAEVTPTLHRG